MAALAGDRGRVHRRVDHLATRRHGLCPGGDIAADFGVDVRALRTVDALCGEEGPNGDIVFLDRHRGRGGDDAIGHLVLGTANAARLVVDGCTLRLGRGWALVADPVL